MIRKKRVVTVVSILLFIGALSFSFWGETVFGNLGISSYSDGNEGWYYPGIISVVGMFTAIGLFSWTREKPLQMLHLLLVIFLAVAILCWIVLQCFSGH